MEVCVKVVAGRDAREEESAPQRRRMKEVGEWRLQKGGWKRAGEGCRPRESCLHLLRQPVNVGGPSRHSAQMVMHVRVIHIAGKPATEQILGCKLFILTARAGCGGGDVVGPCLDRERRQGPGTLRGEGEEEGDTRHVRTRRGTRKEAASVSVSPVPLCPPLLLPPC